MPTAASPRETSSIVVANMRARRKASGWSADRLGDEMSRVGVPWKRSIITNLESGRRPTLTVDELVALGKVFRVEPWALAKRYDCGTCLGAPPAGFACKDCGAGR